MLTEVYLLDLSRFCSIWFIFHLIYSSTTLLYHVPVIMISQILEN